MKWKKNIVSAYNKVVKIHDNVATVIEHVNKVHQTVVTTQAQIANAKTMISLAQAYSQTRDVSHIKSLYKVSTGK